MGTDLEQMELSPQLRMLHSKIRCINVQLFVSFEGNYNGVCTDNCSRKYQFVDFVLFYSKKTTCNIGNIYKKIIWDNFKLLRDRI